MPETFDPYEQWLDIPPADQPPHHYRLLDIDLFESAAYVINHAADLRIKRVEGLRTDQHKALAEKIVEEIRAAKACLLSAKQKAKYDQQLQQLGASAAVAAPRSDTSDLGADSFRAVWNLQRRKKKRRPMSAAIAAAVVLLLAGAVAVLFRGGQPEQVPRFVPDKTSSTPADSHGASPTRPTPEKPTRFSVPDREQLKKKAETLAKLRASASSAADFRAVTSSGLRLVDQAIAGNRPDVARRFAEITAETARKSGSSELQKQAKIAALKIKKLEPVSSPAEQLNLGDQWWELARQEEQDAARKEFQSYAADWYHKALPKLKGPTKDKIEKRIEEIFNQTVSPVMYLADMHFQEVRVNTPAGCTIRSATEVGGEKVFHGLFVHPSLSFSSLVCFDLHKLFGQLQGVAGISDMVRQTTATPLTFRIVGDGRLLWKSRPLTKKGESEKFRVDVSGIGKLELFVDCPGPADSAHAVWMDPVVRKL